MLAASSHFHPPGWLPASSQVGHTVALGLRYGHGCPDLQCAFWGRAMCVPMTKMVLLLVHIWLNNQGGQEGSWREEMAGLFRSRRKGCGVCYPHRIKEFWRWKDSEVQPPHCSGEESGAQGGWVNYPQSRSASVVELELEPEFPIIGPLLFLPPRTTFLWHKWEWIKAVKKLKLILFS